jgi:hypothetical protein
MGKDKYDRAKELFMKYCGSSFDMDREGYYAEYKQYNITKDLELIWREELKNKLFSELSTDNFDALSSLEKLDSGYDEQEILRKIEIYVSENIYKADSFIKLIYCEIMCAIVEQIVEDCKTVKKELIKKTIYTIENILSDILNNPVQIKADRDMEWVSAISPLNIEDYIKNRTTNRFKKVEALRNMIVKKGIV